MRNKQQLSIEDLPNFIIGAEGEGEENSSDDSRGDAGDSSSNDLGNAGSNSDGSQEHDDADDPKVKGLKTALESERDKAKRLEKENKRLAKAQEDRELAEKDEIEREKIRADKAEEKNQRLAAGFLKSNLDSAIRAAAATFIDPTDALDGVDRSKISVEQDDDDPSIVTIDSKSVEKVVKDLATRKPHFLKTGTSDDEPTGSQFGAPPRKKKNSEEVYKENYPSLR